MRRLSFVFAAVIGAALAPREAHAQQQSSQPQQTVRITDRIARNHFENGNEYFRLGRYSEAAREFEHAYEISHQNELLYNVAWSYELAGDLRAALDWYGRFERAGAPGFGLDPLRERMANLRMRIPSAAPSESSSPPPREPSVTPVVAPRTQPIVIAPTSEPRYRQTTLNTVGPFVASGVGAVFAGLAAWQGVMFLGDSNAIASVNDGRTRWSVDLSHRYDRTATEGTLAWVFGGASVAAIAAGVVWLVARGPGERIDAHARRRLVPLVTPLAQGAGIGVGGTF